MRERIITESGASALFPNWSQYWNGTWGSEGANAQTSIITNQSNGKMQDVVTEHFKARSAKGEIINSPMNRVLLSYNCNPLVYYAKGYWANPSLWVHVNKPIVYPMVQPTLPDWLQFQEFLDEYASEADIALAKAWDNVDLSEMQALASLGEMPETVAWIGSLYLRMVNLLRTFSKKELKKRAIRNFVRLSGKKKAVKGLDAASNFWLEFRYAVRPLFFEMKQAIDALKALVDAALRHTARGFNLVEDDSSTTETFSSNVGVAVLHRSIRRSDYRSGVLYRIEADVNKLSSVWGLNQGFETFWELTPLSFVFDWFFNIGNVLSSWQITSGLTPLASWTMEHHSFSDTYDYCLNGSQTMFTVCTDLKEISPGSTTVEWSYSRRVPNPMRAVLPSVKVNLDLAKILDLATIGRGLLRGVFPRVAIRS